MVLVDACLGDRLAPGVNTSKEPFGAIPASRAAWATEVPAGTSTRIFWVWSTALDSVSCTIRFGSTLLG